MNTAPITLKTSSRLLLTTLLLILFASLVASLVQNSGGSVNVQDIKIPTHNGQWVVADLYKPEVALLPIGGFFTMDPKQAALATSMIKPAKVVPMHYGTWEPIEQVPAEFKNLVREASPETDVVILEPGESMEV